MQPPLERSEISRDGGSPAPPPLTHTVGEKFRGDAERCNSREAIGRDGVATPTQTYAASPLSARFLRPRRPARDAEESGEPPRSASRAGSDRRMTRDRRPRSRGVFLLRHVSRAMRASPRVPRPAWGPLLSDARVSRVRKPAGASDVSFAALANAKRPEGGRDVPPARFPGSVAGLRAIVKLISVGRWKLHRIYLSTLKACRKCAVKSEPTEIFAQGYGWPGERWIND